MTPLTLFLKFLFVPLLAIVLAAVFAVVAQKNALLSKKRLIVFALVAALLLVLPALFGFFTYEYVPAGLLFTQISYFLFGMLLLSFKGSGLYNSIGFGEGKWILILTLLFSMLLGGWLYFLLFERISQLDYSLWATLSMSWFLFPLFFSIAKEIYLEIPDPIFQLWYPDTKQNNEYWETVDLLRIMEVTLKVKRSTTDKDYSAITIKAPPEVPFSQWFSRFVLDHNVKFPSTPIDFGAEGEVFGWVFHTGSVLSVFNRHIDFELSFEENKIKDKSIIYAKRVQEEWVSEN